MRLQHNLSTSVQTIILSAVSSPFVEFSLLILLVPPSLKCNNVFVPFLRLLLLMEAHHDSVCDASEHASPWYFQPTLAFSSPTRSLFSSSSCHTGPCTTSFSDDRFHSRDSFLRHWKDFSKHNAVFSSQRFLR